MNEKENQFRNLRRLLKLKRHEIPPPGYFNHFSGNVIARIREGEAARNSSFAERLQSHAPWLANFLRLFEARPAIAGAFGTCLVLLITVGVIMIDRDDSTANNSTDLAAAANNQIAMNSVNPLATVAAPQLAPATDGGIAITTNPVVSLQPVATLFGQQNPLFQSASFAPAGN